jgi:flagellar biosynthesis/type III secretory pathway chaperone
MKELRALLQEQQSVFTSLVTATLREREAIIHRDLETMQAVLAEKNALQSALYVLEEKRLAQAGENTLKEIIATCPGAQKQEFQDLYTSLKKTTRELEQLNTTNAVLIKTELAYLRHIEYNICPHHKSLPYNHHGTISGKLQNSFLVSSFA